MDHPSTPPSEISFPQTPATPRFGAFEDYEHPVKRQLQTPVRPDKTGATRAGTAMGRHPLMTPKTTPRRRVLFPPTTPVRGSGRQGKKHSHNVNAHGRLFAAQLAAQPPLHAAREDSNPAVYTSTAPQKKQNEMPSDGMWYVFRGKKVFRPYAAGQSESRPVPTVLFPHAKSSSITNADTHDSEDDTDHEWD